MNQTLEENELQLCYFNFTSKEVSDDFEELVHYAIRKSIESLGEMLADKCPDKKEEITNLITSLIEMYKNGAKGALKIFKETITDIFFLPPTILLPDYLAEDVVPPEKVKQLENDILDLENEFKKQVSYKSALQKELKKFEETEVVYQNVESLINSFHPLQNKTANGESLFHLAENLNSYRKLFFGKKCALDASKDDVVDHFGLFKIES